MTKLEIFDDYRIEDTGDSLKLYWCVGENKVKPLNISKRFINSPHFNRMVVYMKERAKLRLVEKWEAR